MPIRSPPWKTRASGGRASHEGRAGRVKVGITVGKTIREDLIDDRALSPLRSLHQRHLGRVEKPAVEALDCVGDSAWNPIHGESGLGTEGEADLDRLGKWKFDRPVPKSGAGNLPHLMELDRSVALRRTRKPSVRCGSDQTEDAPGRGGPKEVPCIARLEPDVPGRDITGATQREQVISKLFDFGYERSPMSRRGHRNEAGRSRRRL